MDYFIRQDFTIFGFPIGMKYFEIIHSCLANNFVLGTKRHHSQYVPDSESANNETVISSDNDISLLFYAYTPIFWIYR